MVLGETAVHAAGSAGCRPGAFPFKYLPFIDEGAGNCCPQTALMALGHGGLLPGTRGEPKYLSLHLRAVLKGEVQDGKELAGITPSLHHLWC